MACGASLGAIVKRKCHQEPTTANSERIVSRKTAGRPTLVCRGCAINARWLRPTQKGGPTRLGQVVDSALNGGEPSIDIPVKNLGSVRDRRLEVSWTSRALRQRGGAGESALSIRRHDRRPRSSAFDGITPPEPVLLDEMGSAAGIFARRRPVRTKQHLNFAPVAYTGLAGPRRKHSPERVSQKVELSFRHSADARLLLVHRQLQLAHDLPQSLQGRFGFAPSAVGSTPSKPKPSLLQRLRNLATVIVVAKEDAFASVGAAA
jgi:hypothetical protein